MALGPDMSGEIELRRLAWVGPLTVAASVIAVWIVQRIGLAILPSSLPRFSGSVLNSNEPATVTAVLVTGAVLTFPIVADSSTNPLRSFRRLALWCADRVLRSQPAGSRLSARSGNACPNGAARRRVGGDGHNADEADDSDDIGQSLRRNYDRGLTCRREGGAFTSTGTIWTLAFA
jgi:hypothetical protein